MCEMCPGRPADGDGVTRETLSELADALIAVGMALQAHVDDPALSMLSLLNSAGVTMGELSEVAMLNMHVIGRAYLLEKQRVAMIAQQN